MNIHNINIDNIPDIPTPTLNPQPHPTPPPYRQLAVKCGYILVVVGILLGVYVLLELLVVLVQVLEQFVLGHTGIELPVLVLDFWLELGLVL